MIKSERYDSNGRLSNIGIYDGQGNLIKEELYDSSGNLIETINH